MNKPSVVGVLFLIAIAATARGQDAKSKRAFTGDVGYELAA
jgi:hypothetical protein